jgi:hypothetical protein
MSTPQQPEIARSMRSEVTAEVASKVKAETLPVDAPDGGPGPIPEENLPGHHPEHDQDKPEGPPPTPGVRPPKAKKAAKKRKAPAAAKPTEAAAPEAAAAEGTRRFNFAFEPFMLPFAIPFGVTPMTAWVEVDGRELRVRFGPWSARTSRDNITGAAVTGPYSFPKVAGPAHLSFADGGATFATTTKRGVCLEFREPIPALVPLGLLRHSGLTVTVDDPEGLVTALGY